MKGMGNVSLGLGMQVTRYREKGTLTISQDDCTKSVHKMFGMSEWKPLSTPGIGVELSLEQSERNLLDDVDKKHCQAITGAAMYLTQVTRYGIMYATSQLARAMSTPSKAHMAAATVVTHGPGKKKKREGQLAVSYPVFV